MKKIAVLTFIYLMFFSTAVLAKGISFLVIEGDSFLVNKAIKELGPHPGFDVRFFTYSEIKKEKEVRDFIRNSHVIIVDVMKKELSDYVLENVDLQRVKVYALRGSRNDEALKKKGFIFDREIQDYFKYLSVKNVRNLVLKVAHDELDPSIRFEPPVVTPILGIYHPRAQSIFTSYKDYVAWYKSKGLWKGHGPWIGIPFFSSSLAEGQKNIMDYVIERLEREGFNVLACFGKDIDVLKKFFIDPMGQSRVDLIVAFSLKFYSALNDQLRSTLLNIDIPVINAVKLYSIDIDKWWKDPVGIPPMDVVWTIANPEISGAIEPTPLSGRVCVKDEDKGNVLFAGRPISQTLELLIPRIRKWLALKTNENRTKRIAILFYNHSQGKQKIGASYLNVFRSLEIILQRLEQEGYLVGDYKKISEQKIKELILTYARNVGSWVPGELEKMARAKGIIRLPITIYKKWFQQLPAPFRNGVISQWGRPEDCTIMRLGGDFIIPGVRMGNVLLMPEPVRGWGDDPMKLYHDPTLYPHHQYVAAYLWLKNVFKADAMIHLGTHATHEWLPGKQAGLCPSCPPEVLITDIPNIYPYIVDDVGEGIQAKRRGRGVIIDHLIPAVKQSGLYHEYSRLYEMISDYTRAVSLGSSTQEERFREIAKMAKQTGILKDLNITTVDQNALERIQHYLLEIKESFMPYGLHTFGLSPQGGALDETVDAIIRNNPKADSKLVKDALINSGPAELNNLIKALNGGYIPPGEGNDPLRNIGAIPTGKNFYGFNPEKIPSPSAWALGRKAAEQIIEKKLKDKGKYPQKVAVVLWATETIRNGGINESTILYLMGLKPVWDSSGRVTGTQVIPGNELKRPRIDVLINPSGLYRDLFPNMILFLDRAVQKAAAQKDIENLISKHTSVIKKRLVSAGIPQDKAEVLSRIRIFTERPGSYGTGISEMTGNSGFWKSEEEIVNVYENRVGYAFGHGKWGEDAGLALRVNLGAVDVAVHSISSSVYGTMDNDDMFQYLGGLNLAVKRESGKAPDTFVSMNRIPGRIEVEEIARTLGRELRVRYLNPKWIEGMKKEDYAGAREMANFVEYMWGWQVTTPEAVDTTKWDQTYEVYVKDKYNLDLKEFFDKANPWAHQSITARMLEAVRKGYWKADDKVKRKLAVEYAVSVVEKGVACCDHTCNNPLLNQMVVNIISLPGVMSPEMVERFRIAIEQAMKKRLEQQVKDREALHKKLNQGFEKKDSLSPSAETDTGEKRITGTSDSREGNRVVEGFKMKEVKRIDTETEVASSGVQWFAAIFVVLVIAMVIFGAKRYK